MDEWVGNYYYFEFLESNITQTYEVQISKETGKLIANIEVNGFQTLINWKATLKGNKADKTAFFRVVCKTVLIRTVGEIDSRDIPSYPENLQATMGRTGVVTSVQCNTSVSQSDVSHLLLQMPQNDKAFLLVGGEGVHPGNDAMLAVYRHLSQIAHTPLDSMIDVSAFWICCAGGSLVCHCFFWWFLVSGLLGKFSVQIIQIAVHAKLDTFPDIDPTGTGNVGQNIASACNHMFPVYQVPLHTLPDHFRKYAFKYPTALPPQLSILRKGGVIRHLVHHSKATKPTICDIQRNLPGQAAFRLWRCLWSGMKKPSVGMV